MDQKAKTKRLWVCRASRSEPPSDPCQAPWSGYRQDGQPPVSHPRPLQHLGDVGLDICSSSSTQLHHLMAAVPPVSFLQLCRGCQLILRRSHGRFAGCIRKRGVSFRDVFRRRRVHQPFREPRITQPMPSVPLRSGPVDRHQSRWCTRRNESPNASPP